MKNILVRSLCALAICVGMGSCNYLDIVPDNTIEITSLFETKEKAHKALAGCYSYMPNFGWLNNSMSLAGDEFIIRLDGGESGNRDRMPGEKIMKGWQTASDPFLSYWNGGHNAASLYQGIRLCNIFLENIGLVPDITEDERLDWIAQVKILKAYFHYYLIRIYGPITIVDKNLPPSAQPDEVRLERQPVDECFQYVVNLINEVLYDESGNEKSDLNDERPNEYLGQIDRTIAKAIKAEVLLTQASPLFNGNAEFYSNFKGVNGELLFPMETDPEKWKRALDAIKIAIDAAHGKNKKLYTYDGGQNGANVKFFDKNIWGQSDIIQYCYNNRYSIVEPWNDELIWGYSNVGGGDQGTFQHASQCRRPDNQNMSEYSWQWLCASYRMTELYYTKNGVPINEDKMFDYDNRLDLATIPDDSYHRGYMQPGETTIKMYLNREPRFYSWIAVDNSIWRTQQTKLEMHMKYNEFPGGRYGSKQDDFYWSGIAIKKLVHPETINEVWHRIVRYPNPIIRLADLYLMYAEAYNEYYGPQQEAYDYLNKVRARSGLPKVEDVWSNGAIVKNVNKHATQEGLRDIIQTERLIELSFEGHRYFDLCRWKRAGEFFVSPVKGWNAREGSTYQTFYQVKELQAREWQTPKNYLFPIPLDDINKNPKLVQNPGW